MSDVLIDDVDVRVYTVPTDQPEADGTLEWDSTTMVVVLVRAGTTTGIGWTYGPAECGSVVRSTLAPLVVGSDPLENGATFDRMVRAVRNAGRQGAVGYAISAVDIALWDLKARLLELPCIGCSARFTTRCRCTGAEASRHTPTSDSPSSCGAGRMSRTFLASRSRSANRGGRTSPET